MKNLILSLILLFCVQLSHGQSTKVVRINSFDENNKERISTAFLFQSGSEKGFLTSLHTVAGNKYHVISKYGDTQSVSLKLVKATIKNDLAILVPENEADWQVIKRWGLYTWQIQKTLNLAQYAGKEVRYIGFPAGRQSEKSIDDKVDPVNSFIPLSDILPKESEVNDFFYQRKSPTTNQKIIQISSFGGKGYSGAPLAYNTGDDKWELIGVIAGGFSLLREKADETVFAMPVSQEILAKDFLNLEEQPEALAKINALNNTSNPASFWYEAKLAKPDPCDRTFNTDNYKVLFVWDSTDANTAQKRQLRTLNKSLANNHKDELEVRQCSWNQEMFSQTEATQLKRSTGANLILYGSGKTVCDTMLCLEYYQIDLKGSGFQFFPPNPDNPRQLNPIKEYSLKGRISGDVSLLINYILYEKELFKGEGAMWWEKSKVAESAFYKAIDYVETIEDIFNHQSDKYPASTRPCVDFLYGKIYYRWRKYDQAKKSFTRALQQCPKNTSMLMDFARMQRIRYEHDSAIKLLNACIEQAESNRDKNLQADCYLELGNIHSIISHPNQSKHFYLSAIPLYKAVSDKRGEAYAIMSLGYIQFRLGNTFKADSLFNAAIVLFKGEGDKLGEANAIMSLGDIQFHLGNTFKADSLFNAAIVLYKAVGDKLGEANAINSLGDIQLRLGHNFKADSLFNAAIVLYKVVGDKLGEATAIRSLGNIQFHLGHTFKADSLFNAAIVLFKAVGSKLGEANAIRSLGKIQFHLGHNFKADSLFNAAIVLFKAVDSKLGEANAIWSLGDIQLRLGHIFKADSLFNAAIPLYKAVGNKLGEATTIRSLGQIQLLLGHTFKADSLFNAAIVLFKAVGSKLGEANAINNLGDIQFHLGHNFKADSLFNAAIVLYKAVDHKLGEANAIKNLGDIQFHLGHNFKADSLFNAAIVLFKAVGSKLGEANAIKNLGYIQFHLGHTFKADSLFNAAIVLYKAVGDKRGEANAIWSLGDIQLRLGHNFKADSLFNAAIPLYKAVGSKGGEANAIWSLGDIQLRLGHTFKADSLFNAAIVLYKAVGSKLGEANAIWSLGDIQLRLGHNFKADSLFNAAIPLYKAVGNKQGEANAIWSLGNLYAKEDRIPKAIKAYQISLELYLEINHFYSAGLTYWRLARISEKKKQRNKYISLCIEHLEKGGGAHLIEEVKTFFPDYKE